MNNFVHNFPAERVRKWKYDIKGLTRYKKVIILGSGETFYITCCELSNFCGTYYEFKDLLFSGPDPMANLGI